MLRLEGISREENIKKAIRQGYPRNQIAEDLFFQQSGDGALRKRECVILVEKLAIEAWKEDVRETKNGNGFQSG